MSSADLNNGSPDFRHPEKTDSVDELTRVYGGLAPRIFFSQLVQDFRPIRSLQPELERARAGERVLPLPQAPVALRVSL